MTALPRILPSLLSASALLASPAVAEQVLFATKATNELGIELYKQFAAKDGNICLSPYSIQSAFAMTANGAGGKTLKEMQAVLHYPPEPAHLNASFLGLADKWAKLQADSAASAKRFGDGAREPDFQLMVANRLFGQNGYPFAPSFLDTVKESYGAPLQLADFTADFAAERLRINKWVEAQTRKRIPDLLPPGALDSNTRLVLTNALYFKAAWRDAFKKAATKPAPFHLASDKLIEPPTMHATKKFGYTRQEAYTAVTVPYSRGFVMLLIVPHDPEGLADVEKKLTADQLFLDTRLNAQYVSLSLPKFKIEGETIPLKESLGKLGMKLAFDPTLANFDPMTSEKKLPGLFISEAYHKTFIAVDEKGTEAAAATAVVMADPSAPLRPEDPVVVHVDRPFFYAIMDTDTRTALFLGRVLDPR